MENTKGPQRIAYFLSESQCPRCLSGSLLFARVRLLTLANREIVLGAAVLKGTRRQGW